VAPANPGYTSPEWEWSREDLTVEKGETLGKSYFGIVLGGWFGYLICGFIGAVLLIWIVRLVRPA